jgi:hypothetical protein
VAGARRRHAAVVGIAAALALAIFLLYLGRYPLRHANVPAGFDAPWYIWRAQYVAARGIGPLGTASRPGHAVLSALLGSVTGISQLRMFVVFSQLLPAILALVVGAFAYTAIRRDRLTWAITVGLTGAALGATRLVGENIANLLNLALEVGALVVLVSARDLRRARWGAGLLLVAAALAHWAFAAVCGATLAVAIAIGAVTMRRATASRRASIARDARSLAIVGLGAALVVGFLIVVVLRASLASFELEPNPLESTAKLVTDLARLWPAALIALLGVGAVATLARTERGVADQRLARHLLVAWAVVAGGGIVIGLIGTRVNNLSSLPPHRFLALLVAFPGMVSASSAVWWASRHAPGRLSLRAGSLAGKLAAAAVVVAAGAILLVPTVIRWYRYPILISPAGLQQAKTAAGYVAQLPAGQAFIVVVGPEGDAGHYTAVLRERMVRMELPADRQAGLRIFPGNPADLLAGRRTITGDPRTDQVALPYWREVAAVLPEQPPILIVRELGRAQFDQATGLGAPAIAPGVALLRGPAPARPLLPVPAPDASVTVISVLQGIALLALLWVAGTGWTVLLLGRESPPEVRGSLSPLVGAGALLLGGFVATELGLRMHGVGGPAVYAVMTLSGWAAGWRSVRRRQLVGEM